MAGRCPCASFGKYIWKWALCKGHFQAITARPVGRGNQASRPADEVSPPPGRRPAVVGGGQESGVRSQVSGVRGQVSGVRCQGAGGRGPHMPLWDLRGLRRLGLGGQCFCPGRCRLAALPDGLDAPAGTMNVVPQKLQRIRLPRATSGTLSCDRHFQFGHTRITGMRFRPLTTRRRPSLGRSDFPVSRQNRPGLRRCPFSSSAYAG